MGKRNKKNKKSSNSSSQEGNNDVGEKTPVVVKSSTVETNDSVQKGQNSQQQTISTGTKKRKEANRIDDIDECDMEQEIVDDVAKETIGDIQINNSNDKKQSNKKARTDTTRESINNNEKDIRRNLKAVSTKAKEDVKAKSSKGIPAKEPSSASSSSLSKLEIKTTGTNSNEAILTNVQKNTLMSFRSITVPIKLSKGVLRYVEEKCKFKNMTPVQAATIPHLLNYKDVAVQAVTGSGKTLAFLIPILEILQKRRRTKIIDNNRSNTTSTASPLGKNQIGALVLSPTRELALQTYTVAIELCKECNEPPPLLLVGGGSNSGTSTSTNSSSTSTTRPVTSDLQTFQQNNSTIVIGTPGRVNDILQRYSVIDTCELDVLILDEADVLLNLGFATAIGSILSRIPKMRRTGLFSATQSTSSSSTTTTGSTNSSSSSTAALKEMMKKVGMRNPIWIDVAVSVHSSTTNQQGTNQTSTNKSQNEQHTNEKPKSSSSSSSDKQQQQRVIKHQATPSSLTNYYIVTNYYDKITRLVTFLQQHAHEKIIVFFFTCACVDFYGTVLKQIYSSNTTSTSTTTKRKESAVSSSSASITINIEMLHGKMVQKRREKSMERFRQTTAPTGNNSITENDNNSNGIVLFCTDVAARGLDVSDVQWVIQYDAPQDPSFFIHRVGRAARAGRTGQSLVFVSSKEESYIDFLRMRHVPIEQLNPIQSKELCCPPIEKDDDDDKDDAAVDNCKSNDDTETTDNKDHDVTTNDGQEQSQQNEELENVKPDNNNNSANAADDDITIIRSGYDNRILEDVVPKIRQLVLADRDILEKGTKAFTSFIRAYKEHHCGFIFRFASLDLGILATSFCLLRLPKMPELHDILQKNKGRLPRFQGSGPEVDIFAIPFKDKAREIARQKRLQEIIRAGGKNAKEIKAEQKKVEIERKKVARREQAIDKGRNPDKKRGKHAQIVDEWEDLANEERLYKKLRKKLITEDEYNERLRQV